VYAGAVLSAATRGPWPALLLVSLAGWIASLAASRWFEAPGFCGISPAAPWGAVPWALMLLAMMPPLLARPITHLWDRSLARRRTRAIAAFVAAYASVWMLAGVVLMVAAASLRALTEAAWLPAIVIALAWQATPLKQTCLNRCHLLPRLSAFGLTADRDCLRYGLVSGLWCLGSCWALMLVPLAADGWLMLPVAVLLLIERQMPPRPATWRIPLPGLALTSMNGATAS